MKNDKYIHIAVLVWCCALDAEVKYQHAHAYVVSRLVGVSDNVVPSSQSDVIVMQFEQATYSHVSFSTIA